LRLKKGITILLLVTMQNLFNKRKENEMSLVIDTLNSSTVSEKLSNTEVEVIDGLFDVQDYKSGTVIAQPEDQQSENMSFLAHGNIKVKVQSSVGESTIHILKPRDILNPGDLTGISTLDNGAASQTHTTLYAVGDTKVLSLDRVKFESMVNFQPEIMYHVIQGMVRSGHDILQSMNYQYEELRNYIYGVNGRY
jgi:CRP/FNR family cyclic AMP-dependent transcriptional regulator